MSDEGLLRTLKTLCEYKDAHITQTFSLNTKQVVKVRCLKNTHTIEVTNLTTNTITLFDHPEETVEAILLLMNEIEC